LMRDTVICVSNASTNHGVKIHLSSFTTKNKVIFLQKPKSLLHCNQNHFIAFKRHETLKQRGL
jgi:hypothetical protein